MQTSRVRRTMLALLVLWLTSGCAPDLATMRQLNERQFLLQAVEGAPLLTGVVVRLGFSGQELSFSATCNQHFGHYRLDGDHVVLEGIGQTEMGCGSEEQARDEWLERFFLASPRFTLTGHKLTLTGQGARFSFLDRVVADPDRPLRGTPWSVGSYIEGETAMGLMGISAPTLTFAEDGSFRLRATCCDGEGRYTVEGARVTITAAEFTPRKCEAENDQVAARFTRSVISDGQLRYRIKARALTLESDKRGLVLHDSR